MVAVDVPQIAVWGASGVGKTTYLAGSMLALQTFTDDWNWRPKAGETDAELKATFNFINSHIGALQRGERVGATGVQQPPSRYLFQLEQRGDLLGRNGRYFRLALIDVAGKHTEYEDDRYGYFSTLSNCQGILMLIDPSTKDNAPVATSEASEESYYTLFNRLSLFLENTHGRGTRLTMPTAIVLTKMDRDEHWDHRGDAKGYMQRIFDGATFKLIDRTLAKKRYFAVSVIGRYQNDETGEEGPNLNDETGGLKNMRAWKPHNVMDPLFWLLDELEWQRNLELPLPRRLLRHWVRKPMSKRNP